MNRLLLPALLPSLCLLLAVPATSWANGFEIPEQGARSLARSGAFSARADDPSAAAHNPAGLAKLRGTQLMVSYNALWNFTEFTRAESSLDSDPVTDAFPPFDKRFDTVENETPFFPLSGSIFISSDFGMDNMAFGLSVYGPNSSGHVTFPEDGGSRYLLTELDVLLVYYGASAAYQGKNWGIGATLQWVQLPLLDFSLVIDGSVLPGLLNPYASSFDVLATIKLKDDFALSGIIGAWYQPVPSFEIALSGRPLPTRLNAQGDSHIEVIDGTVPAGLGGLDIENSSAGMALELPASARLGLRYRHLEDDREVFDLELNVLYETWSVLDAYDVSLEGTVDLLGIQTELENVVVAKDWKDTVSIRLGGTWNLDERLSLSAGGFWESGAAPKANSHLDFPSANRYGGGGGITYTLGSKTGLQVDLTLVYHHTIQEDISVSEEEGRVYQQRPLRPCPENCDDSPGVVSNAGEYSTTFHQIGFGLTTRF